MEKLTLDDIARLCGVSRTTVSRALNGYSDVSEETRRYIQEVAKKNNYHFNALARRLATNQSRSIGLITPRTTNTKEEIMVNVIDQIRMELNQLNFDLIIGTRSHSLGYEDAFSLWHSRRVDAFIVNEPLENDPFIEQLVEMNVPTVLYGTSLEHPEIPSVDIDSVSAISQATRLLIENGHRNIAYVSEPLKYVYAVERIQGYRKVMGENGIAIPKDWEVEMNHLSECDLEEGYLMGRDLLRKHPEITAVICNRDLLAFGVMRAAYDLEIRIPDELSIIGFDNVTMSEYVVPRLTTFGQPLQSIGKELTRLVMEILGVQPQNGPTHILFDCPIIKRGSVANVK